MSMVMVGTRRYETGAQILSLEPPRFGRAFSNGWELLRDTPESVVSMEAVMVHFHQELSISGEEFLRRTQPHTNKCLGQMDALRIMHEHPFVPAGLGHCTTLAFAGTQWYHQDLGISIPVLVPAGAGLWKFSFALMGEEGIHLECIKMWTRRDLLALQGSPGDMEAAMPLSLLASLMDCKNAA